MRDAPPTSLTQTRPPGHFWAVGLLSLLWNVWAAYIALSAQSGSLPNLRAEDAAYFNSQPLWFVIVADGALVAGIAGAIALLLRHRVAVRLYAVELAILILGNLYAIALGRSPILDSSASLVGSLVLFAVIALQAVYAASMQRRGLLE